MRRPVRIAAALLLVLGLSACESTDYGYGRSSVSVGYYHGSGWYDPYYRDRYYYYRPPPPPEYRPPQHRPERPVHPIEPGPGTRPPRPVHPIEPAPGTRPPVGRPPPGARPPVARPLPSVPRQPRPARRR